MAKPTKVKAVEHDTQGSGGMAIGLTLLAAVFRRALQGLHPHPQHRHPGADLSLSAAAQQALAQQMRNTARGRRG